MHTWCRVNLSEYPPVGVVVWTTDYKTVRRGVWTFAGPGVPLEEGSWSDSHGHPIAVTAWLPIEESPDAEPDVPPEKPRTRGGTVGWCDADPDDPADRWKED